MSKTTYFKPKGNSKNVINDRKWTTNNLNHLLITRTIYKGGWTPLFFSFLILLFFFSFTSSSKSCEPFRYGWGIYMFPLFKRSQRTAIHSNEVLDVFYCFDKESVSDNLLMFVVVKYLNCISNCKLFVKNITFVLQFFYDCWFDRVYGCIFAMHKTCYPSTIILTFLLKHDRMYIQRKIKNYLSTRTLKIFYSPIKGMDIAFPNRRSVNNG